MIMDIFLTQYYDFANVVVIYGVKKRTAALICVSAFPACFIIHPSIHVLHVL